MDVTERLRIEQALQQAQRLQAVGAIAGGVAHHFNNLLTIVLGNLDLAANERSVRPHLMTAAAAAEQGANLTWQLLSFARRQPPSPQSLEPSEQLPGLAMLIRDSFPTNIAIETEFPPDLWVVEVDPSELQLALLNLASNARDVMPGGGVLHLSARNQVVEDGRLGLAGRYVVIEIADEGLGIPAEILPRVFEPFMTTKEIGAAAGLGLSQVHGFVHRSGGAVDIASEPGRGTIVRIYLPAAVKAPTAEIPPPLSRRAPPARGAVLIVEDKPDLASLAAELFQRLELEIKVVHRASAALELLRSGERVDLVFADVSMPDGMDGLELAEIMKREFPSIPMLLTSGHSNLAADAVTRRFRILRKPYRMDELDVWLRTLLGNYAA
jgi:two-component system, NtrC family, sensor kinase